MIQAIGLTSNPRRELPPAVDDVSFDVRSGCVAALLGARGSGRTTALRLMLELQPGRGITYFKGRPLHRIAHPSREVGVLLGEVPGHPSRTVRGQLRMLCAAVGVPATRADDVLEVVGIVSLRDERLGTLSRGMDRRLGLACVLLADPHTLVLDSPAEGLSPRESAWLYATLRAHAAHGGTVLFTTDRAKDAARVADQVITLEEGRLVADQPVAEFARTRLRPRVAVTTPHATRLATLLAKDARIGRRSVEVVAEGGTRLSVYGSDCAGVGELAHRHGIPVHRLADEIGDTGALGGPGASVGAALVSRPAEVLRTDVESSEGSPVETPSGERASATSAPTNSAPTIPVFTGPVSTAPVSTAPVSVPVAESPLRDRSRASAASRPGPLPPPITVRPGRAPLSPLRYELRRVVGVGTGFLTTAAVVVVSALMCVFLARSGNTPQPRLLAAWPGELPLPPAALGAGLLGALAFGDEFRHPALAADRGTIPRRLRLLAAKLLVSATTALLLAALTVVLDAAVLYVVYGDELTRVPPDWRTLAASWVGLVAGCAWAGLLAAGVFRSTTAGLAAVLAVPVLVGPVVQKLVEGPAVRSAIGLPGRLRDLAVVQWPGGAERWLGAAVRVVAQPVGAALMLSLTALLCAYLFTAARGRVRW